MVVPYVQIVMRAFNQSYNIFKATGGKLTKNIGLNADGAVQCVKKLKREGRPDGRPALATEVDRLIERVLELGTRCEMRDLASLDLDGFAGLGVDSLPCFSLSN